MAITLSAPMNKIIRAAMLLELYRIGSRSIKDRFLCPLLTWPSESLDRNPIENSYDEVEEPSGLNCSADEKSSISNVMVTLCSTPQ